MSCRHDWIDQDHGRALCAKCGTTFPCRRQPCDHIDCRLACGNTDPPPGVHYIDEGEGPCET